MVGFGLGNQTESITLNIIITESNIKMVLDFSLEEQKLLSLLHPSLGIQKNSIEWPDICMKFCHSCLCTSVAPIVSEKLGYFLLFSERNQSHWWVKLRSFGPLRHKIINFGISKEEPSPFSGIRNPSFYPVFIKVAGFCEQVGGLGNSWKKIYYFSL